MAAQTVSRQIAPDACLDDNAVAALLDGGLSDEESKSCAAHLEGCATCRALLGDGSPEGDLAPRLLSPGARLGRYVVRELVGAGAMGVVYAADDPELGRKVALKLLRPSGSSHASGFDAGSARERLLREARALASLSHPNVIAIHDVGSLGEAIFIAMEFAEGGTLRDWLLLRKRTPAEVLAVFLFGGKGLSAAHQAGLVHRDFKPDNVLVSSDGRVRVTDFGLARSEALSLDGGARREPGPASDRAAAREEAQAPALLTRTGVILGTPAYMAPEQLGDPGAASALSDQFSFCVALWEALHGERPFAGESAALLAEACARGELRSAPRGSRVPARLRRVLRRGLHADPKQRFPSMTALLAELDPRRPRRAAAVLVTVIALASAGAGLGWVRPRLVCASSGEEIRAAFGPAEQAAAKAAFASSKRASASFASGQVEVRLQRYLDALAGATVSLCEARARRGDLDGALALRAGCLAQRRSEAAAVAQLFVTADALVVDAADAALSGLQPLETCADARGLQPQSPPPETAAGRAELSRLSNELARARALAFAAQSERGLAIARPAVLAAHALGNASLEARLLLVRGKLEIQARLYPAAEETLVQAAALAAEAHDDGTAADAFLLLSRSVGFFMGRGAEGLRYARLAEAVIHRLGSPPDRVAVLWLRRCVLDWNDGRPELAITECEKARQSRAPSSEPDLSLEASAEEGVANSLLDLGRDEEALAGHRRVAELRLALLGPDHPGYLGSLTNVADDLSVLQRPREATAIFSQILATADGQQDGWVHHRAAAALRESGDFAAALDLDRRSLALIEKIYGSEGEPLAWPLCGEGLDLLGLGRPADALAPLERAEALRRKLNPPEPESRFALARALHQSHGDPARVDRLAAEARALYAQLAPRGGHHRRALEEIDAWLAKR